MKLRISEAKISSETPPGPKPTHLYFDLVGWVRTGPWLQFQLENGFMILH